MTVSIYSDFSNQKRHPLVHNWPRYGFHVALCPLFYHMHCQWEIARRVTNGHSFRWKTKQLPTPSDRDNWRTFFYFFFILCSLIRSNYMCLRPVRVRDHAIVPRERLLPTVCPNEICGSIRQFGQNTPHHARHKLNSICSARRQPTTSTTREFGSLKIEHKYILHHEPESCDVY